MISKRIHALLYRSPQQFAQARKHHHSKLHLKDTAFHRISPMQFFILATASFSLILGLVLNWHATIVFSLSLLTSMYFIDLFFSFYLIIRNFSRPSEIVVTADEILQLNQMTLPRYTLLCPLYKEAHMLPQYLEALEQLDYPNNKLEVLLLLEEDDEVAISYVHNTLLPTYVTPIIVPHSIPKTKPKACNYGLHRATGEYVVIYDAEDMPEPQQLKKVLAAFAKAGEKVACIQAKLTFYNHSHNIITRLFTAEYAVWFDLILPGLQSLNAPIPLGGTSNHFRTKDLHQLKGWDSFNVTEDADLGIRIAKQGYQTAIVDSTTYEEANSAIANWFNQRSRWIKGYMQTYLVHMRDLDDFVRNKQFMHIPFFQLIIGAKILSLFINPLMWTITISYFAFRPFIGTVIESFFLTPILYMGVFSLVVGNFLYVYSYMLGCIKREQDAQVKYVFLVPLYWLAMSGAAWIALYELIVKPHHWRKTQHGLHLPKEKAIERDQQLSEDLTPAYYMNK